jgi:hypothetical protein
MTLGLPAPEQWSDESSWTLGLCWLCEGDTVVMWIGPVVLVRGYDRRRANAYACAQCLERIALLVDMDLRHHDGA